MPYKYNPISDEFDIIDITNVPAYYANQYVTDSGTAIPASHILNLTGNATQGISTSGSGNTVNFTISDATTSQKGVSELATGIETSLLSDSTRTITPAGLSPALITKYVVDAAGGGQYTTIQSGLDAAQAAGGPAAVFIRPGTYTENLVHYDGIDLWGAVGVADTQTCKIIGKHTPPTSGTLTIRNIFLQSATHIFDSAAAGSCGLILIDCAVNVTNGYTFNLPNWTGGLTGFDIGEIGSTNDGWINNSGGAFVFMVNITAGKGTGNTCTISGSSEFYNVHVQCPISFTSTGTSTINGGCWFDGTVSTADTATVSISNSLIASGATQSITHNSSNVMSLSDMTVNSSNNPCIGGSGTILFGSVTYLDDTNVAGTITKTYTTRLETGVLKLDDATDGPLVATSGVVGAISPLTVNLGGTGTNSITDHALIVGSGTSAVTEVGPLNSGELLIGSAGADPVPANLTSTGGSITITNGAGSINLETASSGSRSSFLAYVALPVLNVTGDGTVYTIIYDTLSYNIGSDFSLGTGRYTAPYDGLYLFSFNCRYGIGAGGYNQIRHLLHTSSGDHFGGFATSTPAFIVSDTDFGSTSIPLLLSAGDTVWTTLDIGIALKDCGIRGTVAGGGTNNNYTFFGGTLLYRT